MPDQSPITSPRDQLLLVYAMYALGLIEAAQVRKSTRRTGGVCFDGPAIIDVVCDCDEDPRSEVLPLLEAALREASVPIPDSVELRRIVALEYAKQIVERSLTPYEGARRIWWPLSLDKPCIEELLIFAGLAGECDDDPQRRGEYERHIVDEARALLLRYHKQ